MQLDDATPEEKLEREDGRYYAIDTFNTGVASIATTEKLDKDFVAFGLPSGPGMWLHIARQAFDAIKNVNTRDLFDDHDQGLWPDDAKPLFDFFESAATHVVFSFTALEAFANEVIPPSFVYGRKRKGKVELLNHADIERHVELGEKLSAVLPQVMSTASPKGTVLWEKYRKIKQTRDRIIHLKAIDRKASGSEDATLWGDLLRDHGTPYCDYAHEIIGHYPEAHTRRWFGKYPY